MKKSGEFPYMRISKLGEGEIESVHRTERYVKAADDFVLRCKLMIRGSRRSQ